MVIMAISLDNNYDSFIYIDDFKAHRIYGK